MTTEHTAGPMEQWLGDWAEAPYNPSDPVTPLEKLLIFAREQDAAHARLEAMEIDGLADQLARFCDAEDMSAPHDIATRQCWELIESSVKRGVNPEEVWMLVRAYRKAHIVAATQSTLALCEELAGALEDVQIVWCNDHCPEGRDARVHGLECINIRAALAHYREAQP